MYYKAAIIHQNVLVSTGISQILHELFDFRTTILDINDIEAVLDNYDLLIISSNVFTSHHKFFYTRKHKTIIITSNLLHGCENINIIDEYWSKDKIVAAIQNTISNLELIKSSHNELTKREIEVLQLVVKGHINKEIADILNISFNTVLTHRKNITSKLGIKSISGLSVYAMMNGLIST